MVIGGDAFGVGVDLAIKDIDFAIWHNFAQMVKRAAIAKANFKNDAFKAINHDSGCIQAIALGLQTADNTVETGHRLILRSGRFHAGGAGIWYWCWCRLLGKQHVKRRCIMIKAWSDRPATDRNRCSSVPGVSPGTSV
jgi:hypothetical protein